MSDIVARPCMASASPARGRAAAAPIASEERHLVVVFLGCLVPIRRRERGDDVVGTELNDLTERNGGVGRARLVVEHADVAPVRVASDVDPHALYLRALGASQREDQLRVAGWDEARSHRFVRYREGVR